jgi:hypothetical protein
MAIVNKPPTKLGVFLTHEDAAKVTGSKWTQFSREHYQEFAKKHNYHTNGSDKTFTGTNAVPPRELSAAESVKRFLAEGQPAPQARPGPEGVFGLVGPSNSKRLTTGR